MDPLGKIFGSMARVRIMRLFLFNDVQGFDLTDVSLRTDIKSRLVERELDLLTKVGFLKKKLFVKELEVRSRKKGHRTEMKKKQVRGWGLEKTFPLCQAFKNLLVDSDLVHSFDLPKRLQSSGNIKLIVLSGIFMKDEDRKVDMLIVGDKLEKKRMERALHVIETEIGKELRYAIFDTKEFTYRMNMYDKLLRDIFDYGHQKVVNKLGFFG